MSKKSLYIIIAFLALINLSVVTAVVKNKALAEEKKDEPMLEKVVSEQLGVNNAQAAEIASIRRSFSDDLTNRRILLRDKQLELLNLVRSENPDLDAVDNIINEIGMINTQLQKDAIRRMIQEKNLLLPRQRARYFQEFRRKLSFGRGRRVGSRQRSGRGNMRHPF